MPTSTSTSTGRPPLAALPPLQQPNFNPMAQVFSIFQGLGQNFKQTFNSGQPEQPGYLVPRPNPADNAGNAAGNPPSPAGGNILLDLMNRAQKMNGSTLVTAFRDRVDRIADNNVVIMRLSSLFGGQNRTRRQTDDVKPEEAAKPDETKPAEATPAEAKPTETIDDVVKRLKDQKEQSAPPPARGTGIVSTSVGAVGQIPSALFEGLDGLLGVGSISGQGMTETAGVRDPHDRARTAMLTVAHAETHFGEMNAPETRARIMRERFEERRARHEERRREWSEKLRERRDRRRSMRRGNDDTVIKPPADQTADKPDLTDPLAQPVGAL